MVHQRKLIHPLATRIFHWVNAVVLFVMITSGWLIYNASPLFAFKFPKMITLGNWLAGALQLHFAAMWLLMANLAAYLLYGLLSGHFKRTMLPLSFVALFGGLNAALRGQLDHKLGTYNVIQRAAYLSILLVILLVIASGFAIWKPVQLQALTSLMGGYERARYVHFAGMAIICAFTLFHVALVAFIPKTLLPMITGWGPSNIEAADRDS